MKDWSMHLRSVVARSFSPEARLLTVTERPNLVMAISWKLGSDPTRPGKRSKTIRLVVEEEALMDYGEAPIGQRRLADARLEEHLNEQLLRLDADHDSALGREPPVVLWTIGAVTLLG
jgi:hypothetical protein